MASQDDDKKEQTEAKVRGLRELRPLLRLLQVVRPYQGRFWLASLTLLVSSAIGLLYPQAARMAVDLGVTKHSMAELNRMVVLLVAAFVVQAGFIWVRHYLMSWLGQRVVTDLRTSIFDRLVLLPPSWFHERSTGEILSRFASDVAVVDGLVGTELSMALRNGATLMGGLVLLFYENWRLTLMMLAIVPPVMIGIVFFGKRVRAMSREVSDRLAKTTAKVAEVVSAIQTVQSFVREEHERQEYRLRMDGVFDETLRLVRVRSTFHAALTFSVSLSIAAVVWVGGRAVVAGELSAGDLAAFMLYTAMVAGSVGALATLAGALSRASGATERLFEILDAQPGIASPPNAKPMPAGQGEILFDDVHFAYPSRPEVPVIDGVTLRVPAGKAVALVGGSGAGKTTLTALLQRFADVQGGRVVVDGVDVREVHLAQLRRVMAIVAQEPVLFKGTIFDNIRYGRPEASAADVEQAARDAHAQEFIERFPDGYQTLIGERGVKLSGGQRQRIAIARALLANPRVLILDEATSNLDAQSESLVQLALQRLMQGRTTLIIAHRLSTVRDADAIAVLERGKLVEVGRHEDLLQREGVYRRLVEHQVFADTLPRMTGVEEAA